MNSYIVFYKGNKITIEAETSYKAQLKALEEYKDTFPRLKIKGSDLTVKLAEKDGKQVTTHCESYYICVNTEDGKELFVGKTGKLIEVDDEYTSTSISKFDTKDGAKTYIDINNLKDKYKKVTIEFIKEDLKESNVTKILRLLEGAGKVTIEKSQGEYRVPAEDGYEDGAYYTDDKDDAIGVAKKVFGDEVVINYRTVPEFVGGKYDNYRPKAKKSKKIKEDVVNHDKRVGRIIKAQKALDIKGYSVAEIGWMSDKERKDTLDRLETKIEAEKKKGNLKDYVLSHLS